MIFRQWYTRLRRVRVLFIVAVVVLGGVFVLFEEPISRRLAPTCDAPPTYHDDVPLEVRSRIDTLFDNGLLYCGDPQTSFRGLEGPIYWGSDGMQSHLFFQAEDMRGVGLRAYGFASGAFGEGFMVSPPGDGPPAGYGMHDATTPSRTNQAGVDDPSFYYRVGGAPADTDNRVHIVAQGRSAEPETGGIGQGSVWSDIDRVLALFGEEDTRVTGTSYAELDIPIRPALWEDLVQRQAQESLTDVEGRPLTNRLPEAGFDEPAVWQTVTGLFGNTVWVAGVDLEREPALRLALEGRTFEPHTTQLWDSGEIGVPLAMFAFDPLPVSRELEALYWADEDRVEGEPDAAWSISFPE